MMLMEYFLLRLAHELNLIKNYPIVQYLKILINQTFLYFNKMA